MSNTNELYEEYLVEREEIEDFYNNIKMVENREGKKYKIKDYGINNSNS